LGLLGDTRDLSVFSKGSWKAKDFKIATRDGAAGWIHAAKKIRVSFGLFYMVRTEYAGILVLRLVSQLYCFCRCFLEVVEGVQWETTLRNLFKFQLQIVSQH
jgi:hypothetical protein